MDYGYTEVDHIHDIISITIQFLNICGVCNVLTVLNKPKAHALFTRLLRIAPKQFYSVVVIFLF